MNADTDISEDQAAAQPDLSALIVPLLKSVLYRDEDAPLWAALLKLQARVRDYVAVLGLDLVLDEAEGYAFLRSKPGAELGAGAQDAAAKLPRLIARRQLSFHQSLLLALLRKKLAELDATGGETRLILSREQIAELLRVFVPIGSNESRLIDQVDTLLNKTIELGFMRRLKPSSANAAPLYEVRRILKAFVDAQWLGELEERLARYAQELGQGDATVGGDE